MIKLNKKYNIYYLSFVLDGKALIMFNNFIFLNLGLTQIIIIAVIAILIFILLGIIITRRKYRARYRRFYRRVDKTITKKYNGNMLIENLINKYSTDNSNTYKTLKRKGKNLTKSYLEYYKKVLPEQVLLRSFISSDRNKSELVIMILDENQILLYQWDKSKTLKSLLKAINKYQMLTPYIAYLYELPRYIDENKPYQLINHDNDNILAYEIAKNTKKALKKYKPTRKEKKARKIKEKSKKK